MRRSSWPSPCDLRLATPGSRFGFAEGSAAGIAEIDAVFHHPQTREIVRKAVGGFS